MVALNRTCSCISMATCCVVDEDICTVQRKHSVVFPQQPCLDQQQY